jgi:hypothetical protein
LNWFEYDAAAGLVLYSTAIAYDDEEDPSSEFGILDRHTGLRTPLDGAFDNEFVWDITMARWSSDVKAVSLAMTPLFPMNSMSPDYYSLFILPLK